MGNGARRPGQGGGVRARDWFGGGRGRERKEEKIPKYPNFKVHLSYS